MNRDKRNVYLQEVAIFCHSPESLVQHLMDIGILEVKSQSDDNFLEDEDLETIKRAARLQRAFGVNEEGVDIILHMRTQLSALRKEMENMKRYYSQFDRNDFSILDIED